MARFYVWDFDRVELRALPQPFAIGSREVILLSANWYTPLLEIGSKDLQADKAALREESGVQCGTDIIDLCRSCYRATSRQRHVRTTKHGMVWGKQ